MTCAGSAAASSSGLMRYRETSTPRMIARRTAARRLAWSAGMTCASCAWYRATPAPRALAASGLVSAERNRARDATGSLAHPSGRAARCCTGGAPRAPADLGDGGVNHSPEQLLLGPEIVHDQARIHACS